MSQRPWQGTVAQAFDREGFEDYVRGLTLSAWRPQFVVVHNSGVPMFKEWHRVPGPTRMKALERYYRDEKGWSAGPHLFVADDFIWVFTPLTTHGVHAPSWNDVSWGVETVGDWNTEQVPPPLYLNTVIALAALHRKIGASPSTMRFHREDPLTTHKVCPGSNLQKGPLIQAVGARLIAAGSGSYQPDFSDVSGGSSSTASRPVLKQGDSGQAVMDLQRELGMTALGYGLGKFGPRTKAAVIAFQRSQGLTLDGEVGPETRGRLME